MYQCVSSAVSSTAGDLCPHWCFQGRTVLADPTQACLGIQRRLRSVNDLSTSFKHLACHKTLTVRSWHGELAALHAMAGWPKEWPGG